MERLRLPAVIKWRRGKITDVIRSSSSRKSDLHFDYDAMPARRNENAGGGNRICKIVKPRNGSGVLNQAGWTYTYYTRDAQGNVIAVYERDYMYPGTNFFDELTLKENDLYGSSRVGLKNDTTTIASRKYTFVTFNSDSTFDLSSPGGIAAVAAAVNSFTHALGRKSYELVNHLGNVLVRVSDMRTANSNLGTVYSYNAVVMSATDYYAFGSPMPGRIYTSTSYRYGFNGKENDPESVGTGEGLQDYGMRIYNPALGKFLSVDPLSPNFPELTPYQFASNEPISAIDLDGLERYVIIYEHDEKGNVTSAKIQVIYTTDVDGNQRLVDRDSPDDPSKADPCTRVQVVNHYPNKPTVSYTKEESELTAEEKEALASDNLKTTNITRGITTFATGKKIGPGAIFKEGPIKVKPATPPKPKANPAATAPTIYNVNFNPSTGNVDASDANNSNVYKQVSASINSGKVKEVHISVGVPGGPGTLNYAGRPWSDVARNASDNVEKQLLAAGVPASAIKKDPVLISPGASIILKTK